MQNLEDYIREVVEQTRGYTEIEKIRYVYLDLGMKLHFDTDFSFGDKKKKLKIYKSCEKCKNTLSQNFLNGKIICLSAAYLLEYVLSMLGIKITTIGDGQDYRGYEHHYNIVRLKDGREMPVDLQSDLQYIQSRMRTRFFGKSLISNSELEKIDLEIGYILESEKYTDDFFCELKEEISKKKEIESKVETILKFADSFYDFDGMEYIERRFKYKTLIDELLGEKVGNRVHFIDMYSDLDGVRNFQLCVIVITKDYEPKPYLYSNQNRQFADIGMERLVNLIKFGMVSTKPIPGINKYIK